MMKNVKTSITLGTVICIILLGMFSTISIANGNYNVALTKGTEVFTVSQYDETAWNTIVNSSTNPSAWFEGDSNYIGAKSKNTIATIP